MTKQHTHKITWRKIEKEKEMYNKIIRNQKDCVFKYPIFEFNTLCNFVESNILVFGSHLLNNSYPKKFSLSFLLTQNVIPKQFPSLF